MVVYGRKWKLTGGCTRTIYLSIILVNNGRVREELETNSVEGVLELSIYLSY